MEELHPLLQRAAEALAGNPLPYAVYFALTALLFVLSLLLLWKTHARASFWCLALFIFATLWVTNATDDAIHHLYRIVAIGEQLRSGEVSLLLLNPIRNEALPTFVFYSFLPYLLPVLLNQLGVGAVVAYKLALGLQLLVFTLGVARLVERHGQGERGFLPAVLLLTANYVFCNWVVRSAFAELAAYSLIPWVIRFALDPVGNGRKLLLLLALQMAIHPVVFLHGMVGEVLVAWALSNTTLPRVLRALAPPFCGALVLSSPFWAPQLVWKHTILGPGVLPIKFEQTFLSLRELLGPSGFNTLGIWLFVALGFLTLRLARWRALKPAVLLVACVLSLAIQSVHLRDFAVHIPTLGLSLFVWRLMFISALLAFGLLLSTGAHLEATPLRLICSAALASMFFVCFSRALLPAPSVYAQAADRPHYEIYSAFALSWGTLEFAPDYAGLPHRCDLLGPGAPRRVSYLELRSGLRVDARYVGVWLAPLGFVGYRHDEVPVAPVAACEGFLVFGPFQSPGVLRADELWLQRLLLLRLLVGTVLVAGAAWVVATGSLGRGSREAAAQRLS